MLKALSLMYVHVQWHPLFSESTGIIHLIEIKNTLSSNKHDQIRQCGHGKQTARQQGIECEEEKERKRNEEKSMWKLYFLYAINACWIRRSSYTDYTLLRFSTRSMLLNRTMPYQYLRLRVNYKKNKENTLTMASEKKSIMIFITCMDCLYKHNINLLR